VLEIISINDGMLPQLYGGPSKKKSNPDHPGPEGGGGPGHNERGEGLATVAVGAA